MTEEQSLKKRLIESQSSLEIYKSESLMKINNLENSLKRMNLEIETLNERLLSEQNETELSRYSSLSKINEYNSQINELNDKINSLESTLNATKKSLKSAENQLLNQVITFYKYRKTSLLLPGLDHFSNLYDNKMDIFPSLFKNRFNRGFTADLKINLI